MGNSQPVLTNRTAAVFENHKSINSGLKPSNAISMKHSASTTNMIQDSALPPRCTSDWCSMGNCRNDIKMMPHITNRRGFGWHPRVLKHDHGWLDLYTKLWKSLQAGLEAQSWFYGAARVQSVMQSTETIAIRLEANRVSKVLLTYNYTVLSFYMMVNSDLFVRLSSCDITDLTSDSK